MIGGLSFTSYPESAEVTNVLHLNQRSNYNGNSPMTVEGLREKMCELREDVFSNELERPQKNSGIHAIARTAMLEMYEGVSAEIHFRIWGQHDIGNYCAVFKRDSDVMEKGTIDRTGLDRLDQNTIRNDSNQIQNSVLIKSREAVEDDKIVADSAASTVRLNVLDQCSCRSADSAKLLCTVFLKIGKGVVDRELVDKGSTGAERFAGELPDQMIQTRSEVVNAVSQHDAPFRRKRCIELYPITAMNAGKVWNIAGRQTDMLACITETFSVVLGDEFYGLSIVPGFDLPIEKIEMVFCPLEFQTNAVEHPVPQEASYNWVGLSIPVRETSNDCADSLAFPRTCQGRPWSAVADKHWSA